MNYQELINNLKELNITPSILHYIHDKPYYNEEIEELKNWINFNNNKSILEVIESNFGSIELVKDYHPDKYYRDDEIIKVFHFINLDIYIRIEGYYDSCNCNSNFSESEYTQVFPVEKTIIKFLDRKQLLNEISEEPSYEDNSEDNSEDSYSYED